jgi:hypothetical protein
MNYTGAQPDEVFVGNTHVKDGVPEYLCSLATIRIGDQALDIEGNKIDQTYMRPLFVGRAEVGEYNRIMTSRTFPGQL